MALVVRDARLDDLAAITELQNALLDSTAIEWAEEPHTVDERRQWFERQTARGFPVLVADDGGRVVGWTSFGDFRDTTRWPGYRFTAELTIHVAGSHWRSGVGTALMEALIDRARRSGLHALVAGVDGENVRSLRFHQRMGFVEVARMPQVGAKFGRWLDLVLLQFTLDDRPQPPG